MFLRKARVGLIMLAEWHFFPVALGKPFKSLSHSLQLGKILTILGGSILWGCARDGILFVKMFWAWWSADNCISSFGFTAVLEHLHTLSIKTFNHSFRIYWTNINWIPETLIHVSIKQGATQPHSSVKREKRNWKVKGR